MKKNLKNYIRKVLVIILVLLLCGQTLAAIVSDNDGAAFITKAEFDSLKNNFQSELNRFNTNIDNKIDGAISSYLSGVKRADTRNEFTINSGDYYMYDNSNASTRMRYVYGPPALKGTAQSGEWSNDATYGKMVLMAVKVNSDSSHNTSNWWQTKLAISDVDETNQIAAWKGRYTKAYDEIDVTYTALNFNSINWGQPNTTSQLTRYNRNRVHTNTNLYSKELFHLYTLTSLNISPVNIIRIYLNRVDNYWGNKHNDNIILFGNTVAYDCFSNINDNRNWGYPTSNTSETLKQTLSSSSDNLAYLNRVFKTGGSTFNVTYCTGRVVAGQTWDGTKVTPTRGLSDQPYWCTTSDRTDARWYSGDYWVYPGIGFETTYIKNFNRLYLPAFDNFADEMFINRARGYDRLFADSGGNHHLPISAGVPLVSVNKNEKVQLDIKVADYSLDTTATSANYGKETRTNPSRTYIWAKSSPFITNDPNSEADLRITGTDVQHSSDSNYNKGYYILTNESTIQIEGINSNCTIFLKWSTKNKNGGGVLTIPSQVKIEKGN